MQRHIGKYIHKLRIEAGLSQDELALRINKSKSLVSHIESKGKVNDKTLRTIAKELNVSFETLKVYPYMEFENQSGDLEALKIRVKDLEREIELARKVIDGYEKVIELLESKVRQS